MQIKSTYMYWVLTICMALYEVSLLKTKQFHLNFSFSFRVCDDLGKKELHWISQIYLLETKMNIWCGWGCQNTQKQINKLTKKILGALLYLIKSFQNHNALMSLSKILNSVISKLFELSLNPWNFAGPSRTSVSKNVSFTFDLICFQWQIKVHEGPWGYFIIQPHQHPPQPQRIRTHT